MHMILCDILLASIDRRVNAQVADSVVVSIFRYVDDYLVVLPTLISTDFENIVGMISSVFTTESHGLTFTHERSRETTASNFEI